MEQPPVHIEESEPHRVSPIELAPVDIAAFVDTFAQGPYNEPVPVSSWREFQMLFGGFDATSEASYAVFLFFENGGEFAWVVRVPDPAESGLALVGAGGERQASPAAMADALVGDSSNDSGIYSLRTLTLKTPALLAIPRAAELGAAGVRVYREALALCQELRMFLLVDPPLLTDSPAELRKWLHDNPDLASPLAALYYPRLMFPDALQNGRNRSFGPSGAVAGLYSWFDQERGVWKSPAGLHAALEAVTLGRELAPEDLPALVAASINPIRDLPGHGTVLWGARTLGGGTSPEWKYVPIRRFLLAIERSLHKDLQWVVFEPNDEPLWARMREAVERFLDSLWRKGALVGSRGSDAWFVRCDASTMTPSDIAEGRVILLVGLATVKPAEFSTLRLVFQSAAEEESQ